MSNSLSTSEKSVLHALVGNPSDNDRKISEITGLKLSTVTAIRRRLFERGYFTHVRIPCLQVLGCEMLTATYSHYRATVPIHIRLITGKQLIKSHKEVFWAASEYTQAISFQLSRNLTDSKRNIVELEQLYTAQSFLDEDGVNFIPFPFEISEIPFFFDFEPLIRQSFGVADIEDRPSTGYPTERADNNYELTSTGKKVYLGLIEHPDFSDTQLSEAISVSQRTVTKLRKKFEDEGIIKTIIVPDLEKLGFKMLVFDHAKLNLRVNKEHRNKILKILSEIKPPILLAIGGNDVIALTAYEDFETYRKCVNSFSEVYKQDDIFLKEPNRMLFSFTELEILKNHVYSPIVEKILGMNGGSGE